MPAQLQVFRPHHGSNATRGYYPFLELNMKKILTLLILSSLALASCGRLEVSLVTLTAPAPVGTPTYSAAATETPTPYFTPSFTPPPPPIPMTFDLLANAEYHSVVLEADQADFRLENGIHSLPHLPEESDSAWYIGMSNRFAYGDLNGDSQPDAAVILESQMGGTGHFLELAAVLNQNGVPYNISSTYLGDRVIVRSIAIENGVIVLDMVVHGPNDPLMGPSIDKTFQYQLFGTELVNQTSSPDLSARVTVTPFTPFPDVVCSEKWFFTFEYDDLGLGYYCPAAAVRLDALGQDFEGGRVIRMAPDPAYPESPYGTIYVIYNDGDWETFVDGWDNSQISSDQAIMPPTDRYQPVDAIGWVWRENPEVRRRLGWAYEAQAAFQGRYQRYQEQPGTGGDMHYTFIDHGKWGLVLLLNAVDMGPNAWSVVGAY
jgi:hypothetical protein